MFLNNEDGSLILISTLVFFTKTALLSLGVSLLEVIYLVEKVAMLNSFSDTVFVQDDNLTPIMNTIKITTDMDDQKISVECVLKLLNDLVDM